MPPENRRAIVARMWKEEGPAHAHEGDAPSAVWVLWVAGWSLLVGTLVAVVPCYFLVGKLAALWAAGGVALTATIVTWLSAEAQQAVLAERQRDDMVGERERATSSQ